MKKIKGVFFDLGGTLRICEENPGHQEKAKARRRSPTWWRSGTPPTGTGR